MRCVIKIAVVAAIGLAVFVPLSNLAIGAYLRARHPAPGEFYRVNGRRMHMYCTGQGSPAVILESGGGDDWLYWQKVQPEVAKTTRVCSYDRAGLGWSEFQAGPRDAKNISSQLHSLLQQAGEKGPLVMVGASVGGFYVRQFVSDYPSHVAVVVLVDSSVPAQFAAIPGRGYSSALLKQKHREAERQKWKEASGWARLSGDCNGDVEKGLEAYAGLARAEACYPPFETSAVGEWDEFWHSGEEAARAECCGDLPLLIISQDPDRPKPGWKPEDIAAQPIWNALQESLKQLSPRSRRVIARGSGHHVMIDRPEIVVRGITDAVHQARGASAPIAYGMTTAQ